MRKIEIALFVLAACLLAIGIASYFKVQVAVPQLQPTSSYY